MSEKKFWPSFKHSISITFVHQFEAMLRDNALPTSRFAKNAGISDSVFEYRESRITPKQFSEYVRAVIQETGDEFLVCGESVVPSGHFEKMAHEVLHFQNLHLAYLYMCNYYNATLDWLKVSFVINGDFAEIKFRWLTETQTAHNRLLKEIMTIIWHRFPSWLIGEAVSMKRVDMDFAEPEHKAEYSLMYPCQVTFDNHCLAIQIDQQQLGLPILQTEATLSKYLRSVPLNWFSKQVYLPDINKRVIAVLESATEPAHFTIEQVASKLNMCSRTLRRKLDHHSTSFQLIKDEIRRDLSIQMLIDNKSLTDIAHTLGFSDTSAYSRAFKKWTGMPPSSYMK